MELYKKFYHFLESVQKIGILIYYSREGILFLL